MLNKIIEALFYVVFGAIAVVGYILKDPLLIFIGIGLLIFTGMYLNL